MQLPERAQEIKYGRAERLKKKKSQFQVEKKTSVTPTPVNKIPGRVQEFLDKMQQGEGPRILQKEFGHLEEEHESTFERRLYGGTTTDESYQTKKEE